MLNKNSNVKKTIEKKIELNLIIYKKEHMKIRNLKLSETLFSSKIICIKYKTIIISKEKVIKSGEAEGTNNGHLDITVITITAHDNG